MGEVVEGLRWEGRIVVDATNDFDPSDLDGRTSSEVLADLVAGQPVLPSAGNLNAWLAALGVALTAIYGFGVISRPEHCRWRLGPDSIFALLLFALGIAGLFFIRPG